MQNNQLSFDSSINSFYTLPSCISFSDGLQVPPGLQNTYQSLKYVTLKPFLQYWMKGKYLSFSPVKLGSQKNIRVSKEPLFGKVLKTIFLNFYYTFLYTHHVDLKSHITDFLVTSFLSHATEKPAFWLILIYFISIF